MSTCSVAAAAPAHQSIFGQPHCPLPQQSATAHSRTYKVGPINPKAQAQPPPIQMQTQTQPQPQPQMQHQARTKPAELALSTQTSLPALPKPPRRVMAGLLSIAPELRDLILEEVLRLPEREAPVDPSASQDRKRRKYRDDMRCSDGHDIWVKEKNFLAAAQKTPAIMLVNRQLHAEAAAVIARTKTHYRLDVMYVKECGLWPTWLSVPRLAHHADSIYVQFRIFDPPTDVNEDWRNPRQFLGGDGGPAMIVWNFFAMMKDYLLHGPTAFESLVATKNSFSVKTLILDILPPPPGTKDDNLGFPSGSAQGSRLERFVASRMASHRWPIPPEGMKHTMPAEKLAIFIAGRLSSLLSRHEDYGAPVFHRVGSIDIRVGGETRRLFDLDELLDMIPTRPIKGKTPEETLKQQKTIDDWKATMSKKRKTWG
ncbi:hypothetical protein BN1708_011372, partial [Verticillium longisporum]